MNCNNCKNLLPENSKFCPHCGLATTQDAQVPAVESNTATPYFANQSPNTDYSNINYAQTPAPYTQAPPKKSKKGMIAIISCCAGALLIAGVIFGIMFFSSPLTKPVPGAIISTFSQIGDEIETLSDELPLISFFKDFGDEPFELDAVYSGAYGGVNANIQSDLDEEKLKIVANYMGIGGELLLSSEHITISLPALLGDDIYGTPSSELSSLLSDYLGTAPVTTQELDVFEAVDMEEYENIAKILTDNLAEIIEAIEYVELEKTPLTINDIDITADTYEITLDAQKIKDSLSKLVNEIFADESFLALINNPALTVYSGSVTFTPDELKAELLKAIDTLTDENFSSNPLIAHIYSGRLVRFEMGEDTYFEFNPEGKILDHIAFSQNFQTLTLKNSFEDNVYTFTNTINVFGKTTEFSLTYDVAATSQNLIVSDSVNTYTMDVASLSDKELSISAYIGNDSLDMTITKDSLANDWFNQNTDYKSIEELLNLLLLFGA